MRKSVFLSPLLFVASRVAHSALLVRRLPFLDDNHCYLHTSGRMQELVGSDVRRIHHFGAHSVWPDFKQLLIFFGVRSGPDGREIDAGDFAFSLSFDAIDGQAAELCRRFSCHTFLQSWSEWLSLIANCWNRFFLLCLLELGTCQSPCVFSEHLCVNEDLRRVSCFYLEMVLFRAATLDLRETP